MIITRAKPMDEVLKDLKGSKTIAIFGCGRCATSCQTGGQEQVDTMGEALEEKGFQVGDKQIIEAQCDERLAKKALRDIPKVDAIVSMACGSGASALADLTDARIIPANNTLFLGVIKRIGVYDERCSMCGDCMLADTQGVCVNTRCSKSLLNGPCGGSMNGKCEADELRDCAWHLVTERLRKSGNLDRLGRRLEARRVYEMSRPRRIG
ncbi:methylenetetrahydrofolate reductase C-terminal domain-containing protein [Candidatus Altiarchaeota archaeon]